ncbi:hypothetical protein AND_001889 [Anopheles darlingi]|uniref:Uncharacterized protein n=1 Tax=Anopheles darlingi TaxID=43151 RepID=W5JU91_ANODA|nr:hypothetical protein AND_001889 [Anopheles darlingi]
MSKNKAAFEKNKGTAPSRALPSPQRTVRVKNGGEPARAKVERIASASASRTAIAAPLPEVSSTSETQTSEDIAESIDSLSLRDTVRKCLEKDSSRVTKLRNSTAENGSRKGYVVVRETAKSPLHQLVEDTTQTDPNYVEDFSLTYRTVISSPIDISKQLLKWFNVDNGRGGSISSDFVDGAAASIAHHMSLSPPSSPAPSVSEGRSVAKTFGRVQREKEDRIFQLCVRNR